jgi:hypothetical protein
MAYGNDLDAGRHLAVDDAIGEISQHVPSGTSLEARAESGRFCDEGEPVL